MQARARGVRGRLIVLLAVAAGTTGIWSAGSTPAGASPPTIIGYLGNFDVPNQTDCPEHGFEVEIEDVSSGDVSSTWGNYRYGYPTSITDTTFSTGHTGIVSRYAARYVNGAWSAVTPIGVTEHFGIRLTRSPGIERFNWLCEDSAHPGTLVPYGGTTTGGGPPSIPIPSPVQTIVATPTGPVVEQDVVNGRAEPGNTMLPDAVWVRRYAASSPDAVDLSQLMVDDPLVQQTIQQSMLNGQFELIDGGASLRDDDPVSATDTASVIVYETYRYTGGYDDSHTPSCDGSGGPNDCSNFIGARITTMMAAANLDPVAGRSAVSLTVTKTGSGKVAGGGINCGTTCTASIMPGTIVTLTATPASGWMISGWGGACSGNASTCDLTVNDATALSMTFVPIPKTLTVKVFGPGTVTSDPAGINCSAGICTAIFPKGTAVQLTATPAGGATFVKWGGTCRATGTIPTCAVVMGKNKTARATFA